MRYCDYYPRFTLFIIVLFLTSRIIAIGCSLHLRNPFAFSGRLLRQRYLDLGWLPRLSYTPFLIVVAVIFIATKSNLITRGLGLAKG